MIRGGTLAPTAREGRSSARPRRGPSRWLLLAAFLVLVPVALPIVSLFATVLANLGALDTVLSLERLVELTGRSVLLVATVTATALVVGTSLAWVLVRTDLPGRRLWSIAVALPLAIPSYVIALTLLAFSGPRGLFQDLAGVALPVFDGFFGAWLALSLSTFPYVFLLTAESFRSIDPSLEEAARGLGASPTRVFRTITLPQLRPALGAGALLSGLYALSDFGAVSLMRYDTFTRAIYAQYAGRLDRTPAATLSILLIVLALAFIWGEQRSRGRGELWSRTVRRPAPMHILTMPGRAGSRVWLSIVVLAGVVLPAFVLVAWVARGVAAGSIVEFDWGALGGTLLVSVLAAVVATLFAIPVAILTVRHPGRVATWVDRLVGVTYSLPHITVALAVLVFTLAWLRPLYQGLGVLVVAYAAVFLSQAAGAATSALRTVNPNLEEASRGLGRSSGATLVRVTLPLIWRGLLAGAALVFLTTVKELPITLLLRPTGLDTLAVRVWSAAGELFYANAAMSALLLVLVSVVPAYLLVIKPRAVRA
ncbi:MAG: iron ABC transporter permease [Acidimicrobiia bacterium]|nr:iron ABC transporter permease [Acidimicrobiia bacterium]